MEKIIIGTRSSKLALWQAEHIKAELLKLYPAFNFEIKKIKTTGDKILDVPLARVGGKGLFVKEIEEALIKGEVDIAVHSMKDVPTELPKGLHLAVITKREDPRDALIIRKNDNKKDKVKSLKDLPKGSIIGTSSLRRSCQLLSHKPDIKIEPLRGNLDTRLRKLDEGKFDGIVLAVAGIKRLGIEKRITEIINPEIIMPAIGQGALGIEARTNDERINELLKPLDDNETRICISAERAFLKTLGGGCQVPIAAYARIVTEEANVQKNQSMINVSSKNYKQLLIIEGFVGNLRGDKIIKDRIEGPPERAEDMGIQLAEMLLLKGAKEILLEVYLYEKR